MGGGRYRSGKDVRRGGKFEMKDGWYGSVGKHSSLGYKKLCWVEVETTCQCRVYRYKSHERNQNISVSFFVFLRVRKKNLILGGNSIGIDDTG